jgi:hypothetical protein
MTVDEEITTTARTIALAHSQSFEMGVEAERERIIELLDYECESDHDSHCSYHRMIAIIKGEGR